MNEQTIRPGVNGDKYVPYDQRTGAEAVVYFTRDLSAAGLLRIFEKVGAPLTGKTAIKVHTGEPGGPNIIPRAWVRRLVEEKLPGASIVETNTFYQGPRYETASHLETARANGWDFCPVDILDADGPCMLPVKAGRWLSEISVGKHLCNYDSLLVLTHFKGHTMGGFGGSNKNIGIGCADGRVGKGMIHARPGGGQWSINKEEFMERMTESTKGVVDFFGEKVVYINILRNMSVSCDCEGVEAAPVVTPNIGIVASADLLAVDQASVDLVYALKDHEHRDMLERMESRHGLRQLSYLKELGMGHDRYQLLDIDHAERPIGLAKAVCDVKPFTL